MSVFDKLFNIFPRALPKSDDDLLEIIHGRLNTCLTADPYACDGEMARQLRMLPPGLRAMGATHHLDVSLDLDSVCWHFLNYGEEQHVLETERGLRFLGLTEVAEIFTEAHEVFKDVRRMMDEEGIEFNDALRVTGNEKRDFQLSAAASELIGEHGISKHWIAFARKHPEQVFGSQVHWHQ